MSVPAAPNMGLAQRLRRSLRRDPGLFSMPALLIVSLAITVAIHPQFSDFDLQSLAMGALPLAFAAAAQTVVVISGGIDLSIGSAMAVANVLAASAMEKANFGESLLLAVLVLIAGATIGALNGLIVILSRIPDVVATLTTGFIWGGVALVIMEKPGGGAPQEFLNLGTGTLAHNLVTERSGAARGRCLRDLDPFAPVQAWASALCGRQRPHRGLPERS